MAKLNNVFISYSRRDKDFVQRLDAALREQGLDPWIDWEDIPPSVDWMQEILEGIEAASSFIFVISPDSIKSKVCFAEAEHTFTNHKQIVPIVRRDIEMPTRRRGGRSTDDISEVISPLDRAYAALGFESDAERLSQMLGDYNWIFMRETDDFDAGVQKVLLAIRTDFDYIEMHTRLLLRANEWQERNRDRSSLLRGSDLREAETWLEQGRTKQPAPAPIQEALVKASRRAAMMRLRLQFAGAAYALIVALLAILAFFAFQDADEQRRLAEEARRDLQVESSIRATEQSDALFSAEEIALAAQARILLMDIAIRPQIKFCAN
ncbi:MAG: toll/interleukin-1 receptor domain-containing protein [Anaerolineales bacterium]